MKRIFLYAYDKINLGDDLFVFSIVNRYQDVQFYFWTDKQNRKTFSELKNLKVINKNSLFVKLIKKIHASFEVRYKGWWEKRCNASVYIGGSIFMEYKSWENQINWLNHQTQNYNFFVLGANFGPYKTEEYRKKLYEVFYKMNDVCFRDIYSLNKFKGNSKIRYAPDILFSYPIEKRPIKQKQIFVSVVSCSGKDKTYDLTEIENNYINNMSKILSEYLNHGYNLVLSSFCSKEGDDREIDKIVKKMSYLNNDKIRIINYSGVNMESVLGTLSESEYIIGSRFHAIVLALAANRPVLPIIYNDKTKNMLNDLGFTGIVFDLRSGDAWDFELSKKNLDDYSFTLSEKIIKDSQNHFKVLDQFLKY